MSGIDRANAAHKLEKLGWVEDPNNHNNLIPPKDLFKNIPKSFYVYDAQGLQDLLSSEIDED